MRTVSICAAGAIAVLASACVLARTPWMPRPSPLVAEWIDLSHSTATDTALWVLRADGYDGSAHILVEGDSGARERERRTETPFGAWYMRGALDDTARRAICFARRLGRDGATCLSFTLDTVITRNGARRRLMIRGYRGAHRVGDRELVERSTR